MTIPFKNLTNNEHSYTAAYLKILQRVAGDVWLGALFIMDARGEPVEFTHARIKAPKALLWRPVDIQSYCVRSMCVSMFDACPASPAVILCLADEVPSNVFSRDISIDIPVARLPGGDGTNTDGVDWISEPEPDSPANSLFVTLSERGLLLEPFERAEVGLREVYSEILR